MVVEVVEGGSGATLKDGRDGEAIRSGQQSALFGLRREADGGDWSCRSSGAASRLLHGLADAGREEERRADRRRDRTGSGWGPAPVLAALRRECALVGRGGAEPRARITPRCASRPMA